jgi:AcrR family transcriptional regulator
LGAAGLTHGGFYAHFDSRDALLVAALERAGRDSAAALSTAMASQLAKGSRPVRALVESYLADKHLAAVGSGCPLAALGSEIPRQAEALTEAARSRILGLLQVVGRALPEGAPAGDAHALAGAMVGALQLARALGGKGGLQVLAGARQALIERFDPSAAPSCGAACAPARH